MKRKQAYLGKLRPWALKISILTVALLCLSITFTAYAQLPGTDSVTHGQFPSGLEIGDEIPNEVWSERFKVVNHPEGKESITLNDYKGKLIIFDFWATWCGSCIMQFPRLAKLEKQFQDSLIVIGVNSASTGDTESRIARFRKEHEKGRLLLSVIRDTTLNNLFPHHVIPHYVWIGRTGELRAVTSSLFIRREMIALMLEDENRRARSRQRLENARNRNQSEQNK